MPSRNTGGGGERGLPTPQAGAGRANAVGVLTTKTRTIPSSADAKVKLQETEVQCSSVPVHHQLWEPTQTHVHRVSDAIQLSHPILSPSAQKLREHQ